MNNIQTLSLTEDEMASLAVVPAWKRFTEQLRREVDDVKAMLAGGGILATNADEVAIQYAVNVGRLQGFIEILEYKPAREDEEEEEKEIY